MPSGPSASRLPRAAPRRNPDIRTSRERRSIPMQVILLQRIGRLGQMGDVVNVKDGFARNFLLPQKKALRATEENRKHFEVPAPPARGEQPRAEEGGRGRRREARRQDLRRHPLGRRYRPALRLGLDARHRRGDHRRRLHRRSPPGHHGAPDQGARPARDECRAAPGGRRQGDAQRRPFRGRGRRASRAART